MITLIGDRNVIDKHIRELTTHVNIDLIEEKLIRLFGLTIYAQSNMAALLQEQTLYKTVSINGHSCDITAKAIPQHVHYKDYPQSYEKCSGELLVTITVGQRGIVYTKRQSTITFSFEESYELRNRVNALLGLDSV